MSTHYMVLKSAIASGSTHYNAVVLCLLLHESYAAA